MTKRLLLRPFEEGDLDIVRGLYGDAKIMRYTPFDIESPEASAAHLARFVADWKKEPMVSREYVVVLAATGERIGRCHIALDQPAEGAAADRNNTRAMVGWLLVEKEWGKGYASEIAAALVAYCFDVLEVQEVYGLCHPDNAATRRVMEKCGMQLAECRRTFARYEKNGVVTYEDELEYIIRKVAGCA